MGNEGKCSGQKEDLVSGGDKVIKVRRGGKEEGGECEREIGRRGIREKKGLGFDTNRQDD